MIGSPPSEACVENRKNQFPGRKGKLDKNQKACFGSAQYSLGLLAPFDR